MESVCPIGKLDFALGETEIVYKSSRKNDRFAETCTPGDEQGIEFETPSMPFSRQELRSRRMFNYPSFRNERVTLDEENNTVTKLANFFHFQACHSNAPCRQEHFQLRHCLQVSAEDKIYLTGPNEGEISSYDTLSQTSKVELRLQGTDCMKITTFGVWRNLIATGGMNGQLYLDDLGKNTSVRHWLSTRDLGHITNSVSFVSFKDCTELMVGSNNKAVWFFDLDNLTTKKREFLAPYNVNSISLSQDSNLLALVGDDRSGHVLATQDMKPVYILDGHKDYGFAAAWHPTNPYLLATGNQDMTVRIWDIRGAGNNVLKPLLTVFGEMAAILNVQFSPDGEVLIFSEAADFVHILDGKTFREEQVVDFFGEVMGTALSKESAHPESLYIGIHDSLFSSIYEMRRDSPLFHSDLRI